MATPRAKKAPAETSSLDALLNSAALPEKSVEVCLRGDLVAEVEELERSIRDARTDTTAVTMADRGKITQMARRIEQIRRTMIDSTVTFRFRSLGQKGWKDEAGNQRKSWPDLITAHEPRDGVPADQQLGYNVESFFPALLRESLLTPVMTEEQWGKLEAVATSRQYDDLVETCLALNRRKVDVPFSFAASASLQTSGEKSEQHSS